MKSFLLSRNTVNISMETLTTQFLGLKEINFLSGNGALVFCLPRTDGDAVHYTSMEDETVPE